MSDQIEWKRRTSIRKVEEDQASVPAPPLRNSFSVAARYVGASIADVQRWWQVSGV